MLHFPVLPDEFDINKFSICGLYFLCAVEKFLP